MRTRVDEFVYEGDAAGSPKDGGFIPRNPPRVTILKKSSEKATFFIFIKRLSWFDWTSYKKH